MSSGKLNICHLNFLLDLSIGWQSLFFFSEKLFNFNFKLKTSKHRIYRPVQVRDQQQINKYYISLPNNLYSVSSEVGLLITIFVLLLRAGKTLYINLVFILWPKNENKSPKSMRQYNFV